MSDKNLIISVCVFLLAVGVVLFVVSSKPAEAPVTTGATTTTISASSSPVAQFAQCLKDKGAVFFGAFWCPHCQAQEALFGEAKALLPYVECSTPDKSAQTQICINKKITGYPTWEFADGSRETGEQTFVKLGEKTGCPVPSAN